MPSPPLCIAHRGGPGPENSLAAVEAALALGVDGIEIDIWQIEGELLVTHDRRLGRQLPGQGLLIEQSLAQLNRLRLENGEPIPRLADVLNLVAGRVWLNIEIKGPDCADALAEQLRGLGPALERVLVSSFDHPQLAQMQRLLPEVHRGVLVAGIPLDYARCCDALDAWSLHSALDFTSPELVADAHARGLQHWVYTANHEDDWRQLWELGVDGIFTDRPGALCRFIKA